VKDIVKEVKTYKHENDLITKVAALKNITEDQHVRQDIVKLRGEIRNNTAE
jgi:hypothetical protein